MKNSIKEELTKAGFLPQINEKYYFRSYFRNAIFAYPDDMTFEETGRSVELAPYRKKLIELNFKEKKSR